MDALPSCFLIILIITTVSINLWLTTVCDETLMLKVDFLFFLSIEIPKKKGTKQLSLKHA